MQNELPVTAHGTISLLYNTKSQNIMMAEKLIHEIKEGNVSALKVHMSIKSIENLLKQLTDKDTNAELSKEYKQLISDEADKYPGKSFEMNGVRFSKMETSVKWDYSVCEDDRLLQLYAQKEELEAKIKQREEWLKNIPKEGLNILQEDEVITLFPPNKVSTSTISVTLPK